MINLNPIKQLYIVFTALIITVFMLPAIASVDWYASEVVAYENIGTGPYGNPLAVLGAPSTLVYQPAGGMNTPGDYTCSMVYSAWNTAPDGSQLVVTLKKSINGSTPGYIIVKFATPIWDKPANWYGKDFIVFGNAFYSASKLLDINDDMDLVTVADATPKSEPMLISVSQNGVDWYDYANGPFADDAFPLNPYFWNSEEHRWGGKLDCTKPVPPNLHSSELTGLTVSEAIKRYKGSAGGTAFDLNELPDNFRDPASGMKWIQYIKVTATQVGGYPASYSGEVDAIVRVSAPCPGDATGDKVVDDFDLNIINGGFGGPPPGDYPLSDFNFDGILDDFDLNDVNGSFGAICE